MKILGAERVLHQLGWFELTEMLAARAQTAPGTARARAWRPLGDAQAISARLSCLEALRRRLSELGPLDLTGCDDVEGLLVRAQKNGTLSGAELLRCAAVLEASGRARVALREADPALWEVARDLDPVDPLRREIGECLEPSGELRDEASPGLATFRRRARELHAHMKERVEVLLRDHATAGLLQEQYYSVRNDRYVLPVLAAARAKVPGIVHNASQTGQTLFIEPAALVDAGNELAIAESKVRQEEQRILAQLSQGVGEAADVLRRDLDILSDLDAMQAGAAVAIAVDACPALPGEGPLRLLAARHPLLALRGQAVVANDVELVDAARGMLVSGPNAGGKTVALSTLGLSVLMAHAGLPIPAAAGSSLPLLQGLGCLMGDAQDLAAGLSSYAGQLVGLRDMLESAAPGWVYLIDELGGDTDPREGAALACAALETLVARGAWVLATTHLDEIKALALTNPRFVGMRMTLDARTHLPTYRMQPGLGASSALAIAEQLGLPEDVLARAKQRLDEGGALGVALERLARAERAHDEAARGLAQERATLVEEHERLRVERAELEAARRAAALAVREEILAELREERSALASMIAQLQRAPRLRQAEAARQKLDALQQEQQGARQRLLAQGERGVVRDVPVGVGAQVRVAALGQDGVVSAVDGEQALVCVGTMHTRVPVEDLVVLAGAGRSGGARPAPAAFAPGHVEVAEERCDVRGLRADEALRDIERFLDQSCLQQLTKVWIIHGHGTGALKRVVREALAASPYVARHHAADASEGGDGVTVVELRDT